MCLATPKRGAHTGCCTCRLRRRFGNSSAAHQRFVAGRSMRDVEPSVALSPRDPKGEKIANADDLA